MPLSVCPLLRDLGPHGLFVEECITKFEILRKLFSVTILLSAHAKRLVSSVQWAQRNGIEDDYSLSTELGSFATEAARSRRTFGEDTGDWTTHPPPLNHWLKTFKLQHDKCRTPEYPKNRQDLGGVNIGDYTTHSPDNSGEQTGEAGGRLQDGRGEEPLKSETWLRTCASVFWRLSIIIPVLHTSEIKSILTCRRLWIY